MKIEKADDVSAFFIALPFEDLRERNAINQLMLQLVVFAVPPVSNDVMLSNNF
jgi:hypothetical protein